MPLLSALSSIFPRSTSGAGQQIYTINTAGASINANGSRGFTFTVPAGVTSISIVTVGAGGPSYGTSVLGGGGGALAYANNISVTPGQTYTIAVGYSLASGQQGRTSTFGTAICSAEGGGASTSNSGDNYAGAVLYGTGGIGGIGKLGTSSYPGGGGGAGGYAGAGGGGTSAYGVAGVNGAGGAGGGGSYACAGGGVGIFGQGTSGAGGASGYCGTGGSGGGPSTSTYATAAPTTTNSYGAGAGAIYSSASGVTQTGSHGAVRIVWPGNARQFPSTNVGNF